MSDATYRYLKENPARGGASQGKQQTDRNQVASKPKDAGLTGTRLNGPHLATWFLAYLIAGHVTGKGGRLCKVGGGIARRAKGGGQIVDCDAIEAHMGYSAFTLTT